MSLAKVKMSAAADKILDEIVPAEARFSSSWWRKMALRSDPHARVLN